MAKDNGLSISLDYNGENMSYYSKINDDSNDDLVNSFLSWEFSIEGAIRDLLSLKEFGKKYTEISDDQADKVEELMTQIISKM